MNYVLFLIIQITAYLWISMLRSDVEIGTEVSPWTDVQQYKTMVKTIQVYSNPSNIYFYKLLAKFSNMSFVELGSFYVVYHLITCNCRLYQYNFSKWLMGEKYSLNPEKNWPSANLMIEEKYNKKVFTLYCFEFNVSRRFWRHPGVTCLTSFPQIWRLK